MGGALKVCSEFWGVPMEKCNFSIKKFKKRLKKVYLRLAEGKWKSHLYNHKSQDQKSISSKTPNLKWSILRCVPPYSNISKKSLLCLHEKLEIVTYQNQKELLKRDLNSFVNIAMPTSSF